MYAATMIERKGLGVAALGALLVLTAGACGAKHVDGQCAAAQDVGDCRDILDAGASDECLTCVSAALCACTSVPLPDNCTFGNVPCSGALPRSQACLIGAVELTKCWASNPETNDANCDSKYFELHPGSIAPGGLAISLYECAACGTCRAECATGPIFQALCR